MLGVLCGRPRTWLLASLTQSYAYASAAAQSDRRVLRSPLRPVLSNGDPREDHPLRCTDRPASLWHTILPFYWRRRRTEVLSRREHYAVKGGEGSWNVAWDARPARWLHHPDLAWFLFGVCTGLVTTQAIDNNTDSISISISAVEELGRDKSSNYRITEVVADGRCLFRAIAHLACLIDEKCAPDDNQQRELADELRAQVVQELLKRREEMERFIDEDFDVYVERIQQPYAWGGEPELLMSSHVLRKPICVFMKERSSGSFVKVAHYGEEYGKEHETCINVLFHGYGHYEILETVSSNSS